MNFDVFVDENGSDESRCSNDLEPPGGSVAPQPNLFTKHDFTHDCTS